MNRFADFVSLDSFYSGIRGCFQTHFCIGEDSYTLNKDYDVSLQKSPIFLSAVCEFSFEICFIYGY